MTMYLNYFGLSEPPFAITPDPRFLFLSARHQDALAHLLYGVGQGGGGGFVQLTGEVGTGKTTLCRGLLEQVPENTNVALILNPHLEPVELVEAICDELKISTKSARGSLKTLTDRLNKYLLEQHAAGNQVVLIIDEAQNLSRESLEQVRMLTNLETATHKLLQIILLGQPELRELLNRPDLRQLAQRITARYHLEPLNEDETGEYVRHRLRVAGAQRQLFSPQALTTLFRATGGVPRLINIVAERSLLAAYASDKALVSPTMVRQATKETTPQAPDGLRYRWIALGAGGAAAFALIAALVIAAMSGGDATPVTPVAAAATVTPTETRPAPTRSVAEAATEPADQGATRIASVDSSRGSQSVEAPSVANEPDSGGAVGTVRDPGSEPIAPPVAGYASAWTDMLTLWSEEPMPGEKPDCLRRSSGRVHCVETSGTWAKINRVGMPVVLELPDLNGYAVLEGLGPRNVRVRVNGVTRTIQRDRFEGHWLGKYQAVWTMPGYVSQILKEGDRGPAVLWVKGQAQRAAPAYAGDPDDPYFGPSLTQWTRDFQERYGLEPDGVIGPESLHVLSRFQEDAPTLLSLN